MGRDFVIPGESIVYVKGGAHLSGFGNVVYTKTELGLAVEDIRVTFGPQHTDVNPDSWGPRSAADVMWMGSDARVQMMLVHYDELALQVCVAESMGGFPYGLDLIRGNLGDINVWAGRVNPPGVLLGGGKFLFASGNHYISLSVQSRDVEPWRFPFSYLAESPVEVPLGVKASMVRLNWRVVPHLPINVSGTTNLSGAALSTEQMCSGAILWDRVADVTGPHPVGGLEFVR